MAEGVLYHCYCDYAAFNAEALYNTWKNKDSGGSIDSGAGLVATIKAHPIITGLLIVGVTTAVVYHYKPGLLRPITSRLPSLPSPRRLFA